MIKTTDTDHRHAWIGRAGIATMLLFALGGVMPAGAQEVAPSTKPVTTSLLLSLPTGSIFSVSPGPCVPSGEQVSIAGDVHVVTLVRQGMLMDIHLNMAGVQGTGQTTGNLYIGTGTQKSSNLGQPIGGLEGPEEVQPNFTLEHTDGCASDQFGLTFDLAFGSDGTLLPSSTVGVTPQRR
jgi:hypothetical protein